MEMQGANRRGTLIFCNLPFTESVVLSLRSFSKAPQIGVGDLGKWGVLQENRAMNPMHRGDLRRLVAESPEQDAGVLH